MSNAVSLRRAVLPAVAALAAGLVACGGGGDGDGGGEGVRGTPGQGATFVDVMPGVPASIDPGSYEGRLSSDLQPYWASTLVRPKKIPLDASQLQGPEDVDGFLAESFEREDDGSYTFTLREAQSPAGNPVTSEDVKWTFERIFAAEQGLHDIEKLLLTVGLVDAKEPVTVIDERTFTLNVERPSNLTLAVLSWYGTGIIDSTLAKENATPGDEWATEWLKGHSATFGPYSVTEFRPGEELRLAANPNFFGGDDLAFPEAVIRAVADGASRLQLMLSGEATHTAYLDYRDLRKALDSSELNAIAVVSQGRDVLVPNHRIEAFADPRVRRALSMAIDRDALIESVYHGTGAPGLTQVPEALPAPDEARQEPAVYDPQEAKRLLAEAGHSDLQFTISGNASRTGAHVDPLLTFLQDQFAKVGVRTKVEVAASPTEFQARRTEGKLEAYLSVDKAIVVDVPYYLNQFHASFGPEDFKAYKNEKYDALVKRIISSEYAERPADIAAAMAILDEDVPWIPLAGVPAQQILAGGVSGWWPSPTGSLFLDELEVSG